MARTRSHWTLALLALLPLSGCGGSGGNGGGTVDTTPLRFTLSWGARSRAVAGPSSALSAVVTLAGANPVSGDYSVEIDRNANPASYSQTYTPATLSKVGTFPLTIDFYSQEGGHGVVVGSCSATVTITKTGDGIGTVTTVNTVKSVSVDAGQSTLPGQVKQLTFTAKDLQGSIVAVTPGSAFWTLNSGADVLALTPDGIATGLKPGTASITASVDGVPSTATQVIVNNDPNGTPVVINFDELTGVSSIAGSAVATGSRLSTQYRDRFGISFTSNAGYVAVVNLAAAGAAPSSPNGISAATVANVVEYNRSNPIQFVFTSPFNPDVPGVTKSVSVTADLDGRADLNATLEAYDVAGNKIGEITTPDPGGEVRTLSFATPRIHRIAFRGTPVVNQDGISLDNVTFSPVVAAP